MHLATGTKPAIVVDRSGTLHAAFLAEDLDGWVRHVAVTSGAETPSDPETLARGYFYGPLDIVAGAGSRLAVAYHDHDLEDQVLARSDGDGWTLQPMTNPGHDGWYNAADVDMAGNIHTASYDPGDFSGRGVVYGVWDGTDWSIELAAPGSFDYAGGMGIAVSAGSVWVAFFDDGAGVGRLATRQAPDDWSVADIEPRGPFVDVGRFPDLRVSADGTTLHMVYLARTGASSGVIRYARGTPTGLSARDLRSVSDITIGFDGARDLATMALRSDGTPVVAIQTQSEMVVLEVDDAGDRELARFAARANVRFRQHTSTAVGPDDRVRVGWWQTGEEEPGTICLAVEP